MLNLLSLPGLLQACTDMMSAAAPKEVEINQKTSGGWSSLPSPGILVLYGSPPCKHHLPHRLITRAQLTSSTYSYSSTSLSQKAAARCHGHSSLPHHHRVIMLQKNLSLDRQLAAAWACISLQV